MLNISMKQIAEAAADASLANINSFYGDEETSFGDSIYNAVKGFNFKAANLKEQQERDKYYGLGNLAPAL